MVSWQKGNLSKWQDAKTVVWQYSKLTEWQVIKLASWQSGKVAKWQIDKMVNWQKGKKASSKTASWQYGKVTEFQVIKLAKWQVGKMASWQNVSVPRFSLMLTTRNFWFDYKFITQGLNFDVPPQNLQKMCSPPEAVFLVVCDPSMNELWAT